jgi:hypothetical protein
VTEETIFCGVCGKTIFSHIATPIVSRAKMPSRDTRGFSPLLAQMAQDAENTHQEMVKSAQEACAEHFRTKHAVRLWLWRRIGWRWLMQRRWPWGGVRDVDEFDFSKQARS